MVVVVALWELRARAVAPSVPRCVWWGPQWGRCAACGGGGGHRCAMQHPCARSLVGSYVMDDSVAKYYGLYVICTWLGNLQSNLFFSYHLLDVMWHSKALR